MKGTYESRIRAALRKLANTVSGSNIPVGRDNYKDDMAQDLERIADSYAPPEPPAPELPSVTAADEGKVLTVDEDGEWGAGFGGVTEVRPTIGENKVTLDKTLAEIRDAMSKGVVFTNDYNADEMHQSYVIEIAYDSGEDLYCVSFTNGENFYAATENDYPSYENEPGPEVG